jgi:hypothetical protein
MGTVAVSASGSSLRLERLACVVLRRASALQYDSRLPSHCYVRSLKTRRFAPPSHRPRGFRSSADPDRLTDGLPQVFWTGKAAPTASLDPRKTLPLRSTRTAGPRRKRQPCLCRRFGEMQLARHIARERAGPRPDYSVSGREARSRVGKYCDRLDRDEQAARQRERRVCPNPSLLDRSRQATASPDGSDRS